MNALDSVIDGVHCTKDAIPRQWAQVMVSVEDGCDPLKGEYGLSIFGLIGVWSFEDIDTLRDSVINSFDFSTLPKEGRALLMLEEDGEWDGFPHWMKYYTIKTTEIVEY